MKKALYCLDMGVFFERKLLEIDRYPFYHVPCTIWRHQFELLLCCCTMIKLLSRKQRSEALFWEPWARLVGKSLSGCVGVRGVERGPHSSLEPPLGRGLAPGSDSPWGWSGTAREPPGSTLGSSLNNIIYFM